MEKIKTLLCTKDLNKKFKKKIMKNKNQSLKVFNVLFRLSRGNDWKGFGLNKLSEIEGFICH